MKEFKKCPSCGSSQIFCYKVSPKTKVKMGKELYCICRDCGYSCYGFQCECDLQSELTEGEKIDVMLEEISLDLRVIWKRLSYVTDSLKSLFLKKVVEKDLYEELDVFLGKIIVVYSEIQKLMEERGDQERKKLKGDK